jgi:hypothetical protein
MQQLRSQGAELLRVFFMHAPLRALDCKAGLACMHVNSHKGVPLHIPCLQQHCEGSTIACTSLRGQHGASHLC